MTLWRARAAGARDCSCSAGCRSTSANRGRPHARDLSICVRRGQKRHDGEAGKRRHGSHDRHPAQRLVCECLAHLALFSNIEIPPAFLESPASRMSAAEMGLQNRLEFMKLTFHSIAGAPLGRAALENGRLAAQTTRRICPTLWPRPQLAPASLAVALIR